MTSLRDLLTPKNLQAFGGSSIYSRGLSYFRAGRVQIRYAEDQEAECIVRGTSFYTVTLWVHQGNDLGATCSCPYAANGWFCKHMVAAGMAVGEHMQLYGGRQWRSRLDTLLRGVRKTSPKQVSPILAFPFSAAGLPGLEITTPTPVG